MLVRLFAILLMLGVLCTSTHTPDLVTPDTNATSAFLDDAAELPPLALVDVPTVLPDRTASDATPPPPSNPASRLPVTDLFRPPRAAAFV